MQKKKIIISICAISAALIVSFGICIGLSLITNKTPWVDYWTAKKSISYYDTKLIAGTQAETDLGFVPQTPLPPSNQAERAAKTCLVLDGTTHNALDHNFNQSVLQGESNFINNDPTLHTIDPRASYQKPSSDSPQGFINTYNSLVTSKQVENILLAGFIHATPLAQWAQTMPNAGAIFIDGDVADTHVANVLFRADKSSFLAGLAIGQYLNENFSEYIKDGQLSVGTFGGLAIPTVTIFMGGFELGVWTYNHLLDANWDKFVSEANSHPEWGWEKEPDKTKHEIKFTSLGISDSFFSGNFAQGDGRSVVQELLARKVSCILPVAGPQTFDAVQEIANQKSHCVVIGVDVAQELDPTVQRTSVYADNSQNDFKHNVIKFSAEKNISGIVFNILDKVADINNEHEHPNVGTYGWLTVGDINNEGVKTSDASLNYLLDFFKPWQDNITSFADIYKFMESEGGYNSTIMCPNHTEPYSSWNVMVNNNMEFRC